MAAHPLRAIAAVVGALAIPGVRAVRAGMSLSGRAAGRAGRPSRPRRRPRFPGPGRFASGAFALGVALIVARPAGADFFVVPFDYTPEGLPFIRVEFVEPGGASLFVKAVLDTGNTDGIAISTVTAAKLGLTMGAAGTVGGVGQEPINLTNFGSNLGGHVDLVRTPPGQGQTSIPVTGSGYISPPNDTDLKEDQINMGNDFLGSWGKVEWDYGRHQITFRTLAQTQVGGLNPNLNYVPMYANAGGGTLNLLSNPGQSQSIFVSLATAGHANSSPFVLASGYGNSLISQGLAASLGIDTSNLPTEVIGTASGPITVPVVNLDYHLLPGESPTVRPFGILPDAYNMNHINVLGADILGTYGVTDFNYVNSAFGVAAVPEPASVLLLTAGLAGVAAFARRR